MPYVADFKLSITRALADQLALAVQALTPEMLSHESLSRLESRAGIYQIYLRGKLVYVGKASRSLPSRLRTHLRKLEGRLDISTSDVSFICLYVDEDLESSAPERMLINKYRGVDATAEWNTNGFGNKDPGRNRDRTLVKSNHFDATYPINTHYAVELTSAADANVQLASYLQQLKLKLPFNLRYPSSPRAQGAPVLGERSVSILPGARSLRDHLEQILGVLDDGWQLTFLPGYLILYPIHEEIPSAREIWRTEGGQILKIEGRNQYTDPGEVGSEDDDE